MATTSFVKTYDLGFGAGQLIAEDLNPTIVNIAPWETPLFSTMPKITVTHTTHEWIEDDLAAASGAPYGGYHEGADFTAQAVQVRSRLNNITQIFRKDIQVAETVRAVKPYGVADEYAYQVGIALKELARCVETRLFASAVSASGASTTARLMRPLESYITTNTAAQNGTATKAVLDSLLETIFLAGGNPDRVYCAPNTKSGFATALSGVNYRNIQAADQRVIMNIDVYQSNFGVIQLVPDRFVPYVAATTGYGRYWVLETPKVKFGWLRGMKHVPLPPGGDSVRGMILGEGTIEVNAEKAHGKATGVITG